MRYRRHPTIVEAIEWTGENLAELCAFLGLTDDRHIAILAGQIVASAVPITTPLGVEWARPTDFIVRGSPQAFVTIWPHDTFLQHYDAVEAEGVPS